MWWADRTPRWGKTSTTGRGTRASICAASHLSSCCCNADPRVKPPLHSPSSSSSSPILRQRDIRSASSIPCRHFSFFFWGMTDVYVMFSIHSLLLDNALRFQCHDGAKRTRTLHSRMAPLSPSSILCSVSSNILWPLFEEPTLPCAKSATLSSRGLFWLSRLLARRRSRKVGQHEP